jgi:hypothetical protein
LFWSSVHSTLIDVHKIISDGEIKAIKGMLLVFSHKIIVIRFQIEEYLHLKLALNFVMHGDGCYFMTTKVEPWKINTPCEDFQTKVITISVMNLRGH